MTNASTLSSFFDKALDGAMPSPSVEQLRVAHDTVRRTIGLALVIGLVMIGALIEGRPQDGVTIAFGFVACAFLAVGANLVGPPQVVVIAPLPFFAIGLVFYFGAIVLAGLVITPVTVCRDFWRMFCYERVRRQNARAASRLVEDACEVVHRYAAGLEHTA